uniref:C-Jun-amino-terminal kinase-interacting protein 4-like n=1 Tax=Pristiophorus japonicus TaxID=55135 RepID=UPI00398E9F12
MSEAESFDSFLSEGLEDGVSGLALCDELVSGLAGALYAELERLLGAHGEGAVAGLMPLAVTALETLEGVCAESRERGAQAERAREESERLLAHFERERAQRKRTEEKLLELEDSVEQERKTHKSRLELSASQTRQMELKAKSYLDMTFQLEEEKSSLEKDHKRLLQKYNMILRSLKDLQMQYKLQLADCAKHSGSSTPRENRKKRAFSTEFAEGSSSFTSDRDQGYPDTYSASDEPVTPSAANAVVPHPVEEPPSQGQGNEEPLAISVQELETSGTTPDKLSDIEGIILSTPELQPCRQCPVTSTPKSSEDEVIDRNTDSIFQELQSVGSEFIEELDGGVDLLDLGSHVESFVSENAELREK